MSEEKLYAVKNDAGKYWNFEDQDGFWKLSAVLSAAFTDEESAKSLAHDNGGHVVTLVEEPEKVVLTKEQAEIVEGAHDVAWPANYISGSGENECLLINAYVNGYTVEKPKLWNVKVPHTGAGWWYAKPDPDINHGKGCARPAFTGINNPQVRLTDAEIIKYGLQDCEKMEVKD